MKRATQLFRPCGSALLEVIAAVFVLSAGMTGALSLIIGAMNANNTQMNRIIATNLAQEGIEMIHNMRDTNWLYYKNTLRECWNFWPDFNENKIIDIGDTECIPEDGQNNHPWAPEANTVKLPIGCDGAACKCEVGECAKKYIVDIDLATFRWNLVTEDNFDDTGGIDYSGKFLLYKKKLENGSTFYTHDKTDGDGAGDGEIVTPSIFSREIGLYYIDDPNYDDTDFPIVKGGFYQSGQTGKDNRLLVISRVTWKSQGIDHNVTLSTIMTDYYNRQGGWDT